MNGENQQLLTNEPVEVQDYMKFTERFRGVYGMYFGLIKNKQKSQHVTGWTWKH